MNPSKKLRVAIIGTSSFAEVCHIPGILSHPNAEISAIYGRDAEKAKSLANKFGIPQATADLEALCADPNIDAVTIASANSVHASQAIMALNYGKHVFCEKPLAMNDSEAAAMLKAAKISGKIHQVAFTFRYNYGIRELRRRIAAGDIGTPFHTRIQYDRWDGLASTSKASWRDRRDVAGAGLLFDLGSHLFDIHRHVLGPLESVIGYTHTVPRMLPHKDNGKMIEIETDDIVNAWIQHQNGLRGQFFISRVTPPFAELGYLEVIGSEGALKAALSRGGVDFLKASRPDSPEWINLVLPPEASDGKTHALDMMMRGFVDACLAGEINREVDATFEDGCAAQFAMSALMKSQTSMRWESIPSFGQLA
jgi:predicted dehydrogenase